MGHSERREPCSAVSDMTPPRRDEESSQRHPALSSTSRSVLGMKVGRTDPRPSTIQERIPGETPRVGLCIEVTFSSGDLVMKVDRLFQVLVVGGALLTTGGCATAPAPAPGESAPSSAPAQAPADQRSGDGDQNAVPAEAPSSAPTDEAPKKSEGEGGDGDGVCSWL